VDIHDDHLMNTIETIWNYFVCELMQRDSLELSYLTLEWRPCNRI